MGLDEGSDKESSEESDGSDSDDRGHDEKGTERRIGTSSLRRRDRKKDKGSGWSRQRRQEETMTKSMS